MLSSEAPGPVKKPPVVTLTSSSPGKSGSEKSGNRSGVTFDKIMTEKLWKNLIRELTRYRDAALNSGKELKFVHDYYLISLGWMTGLRVSEVSTLNWGDISQDQWLKVRQGKGSRDRIVYFGARTERLLSDYKAFKISRGLSCKVDDPVFTGIRGGRLGRGGIHYRMKFWVRTAGFSESLSYHSLRHGFATRMLNQGIKLHDLKAVMGHQNIATTSIYLHFTEESREAFRRIL